MEHLMHHTELGDSDTQPTGEKVWIFDVLENGSYSLHPGKKWNAALCVVLESESELPTFKIHLRAMHKKSSGSPNSASWAITVT